MAQAAFNLPATGDYPWVDADYAYAGWVPNVAGHLSFNLIDPRSKEPTYNHQHDLSSPRSVALHRTRLAQDYPFFDFLVRWCRPSAVLDYVIVAESGRVGTPHFTRGSVAEADDANGLLMGVVAVLPQEEDGETKACRRALLKEIDEDIVGAATAKATCGVNPSLRLAHDILAALDGKVSTIACHQLRFALFRTGELRIWFDLADLLGRDLTQAPPSDLERSAAEHLAKQVYYCIKDLLHAHYHHDRHSDQMLPLVATATRCSDLQHEESENDWRYATLRGMARTVVELRQGGLIRGHQQAKGIIAYAQTFQHVLGRCRRPCSPASPHEQDTKIVPYDFGNLAMSLDAMDASAQSSISARLQLLAILIGIILSGLSLWAGAVQIQPNLCTSLPPGACPKIGPGAIVSLVNLVVANPTAFLILLVTLGLVIFVVWFNGSNTLPLLERSVRWLRRLSEASGVQLSRWLRGSDWIGRIFSWSVLLGISCFLGWAAYKIAPKTAVPAVVLEEDAKKGPWVSLFPLAGQRVDQSGLLVRSVIAPELRALLKDEYPSFLKLMAPDSTLVREGNLLVVTSSAAPGSDGAFLIIDPRNLRLEAGLRKDGLPSVHRTVGAILARPAQVRDFLGTGVRGDAGAVAIESSTCDMLQGGTAGRTIQLSGAFRADAFCEYALDLHPGQAVTFDRNQAKGLEVMALTGGQQKPLGEVFTSPRGGKQLIRVVWAGWSPKGGAALKPRPFYVRLTLH